MRLPIFEEIKLVEFDEESIRLELNKCKLGKIPYYVDLSNLSPDQVQEVATIFERILYEANLSPLFPYPVYIISLHTILTERVPVVEKVDLLPKYFKVRQGVTGNKEGAILKKIDLKRESIQHLDIGHLLERVHAMREQNKRLYQLARVGKFYFELLRRLTT